MYIYNVTSKIEKSIRDQWLRWMKEEHIPELLQTGCFTRAMILHLVEADDEEGYTYAVQYYAESRLMCDQYIEQHANTLRQKALDKWGSRFIAFRTIMQVVD